jgi:hypothetical protein
MKSAARLGDRAPSTSTPSTGVDRRSAGDPVMSVVLMAPNLGEATDTARERAVAAVREGSFG